MANKKSLRKKVSLKKLNALKWSRKRKKNFDEETVLGIGS
jgi:hypothetical protein